MTESKMKVIDLSTTDEYTKPTNDLSELEGYIKPTNDSSESEDYIKPAVDLSELEASTKSTPNLSELEGYIKPTIDSLKLSLFKNMLVYLWLSLPVLVNCLIFSYLGYGHIIFEDSYNLNIFKILQIPLTSILILIYVFDYRKTFNKYSFMIWVFIGICVCLLSIGYSDEYPNITLNILLGLQVPWTALLYKIYFSDDKIFCFLKMIKPLICIMGTKTTIISICYLSMTNYTGCQSYNNCLLPFLLWISPLITGINILLFGVFIHIFTNYLDVKKTFVYFKLFYILLSIGFIGLWISSVIAGGAMSISQGLTVYFVSILIASSFIIVCSIGWKEICANLNGNQQYKNLLQFISNDWCKALFIALFSPFIPLYLLLSFLNQQVRYYILGTSDIKSTFTKITQLQITQVIKWNWSSVCLKIIYWGLIWFTLNIGISKIVTVFLSWLSSYLETFNLFTSLIIFTLVGLSLFLLPPVPGVPVYITGGVVLPKLLPYNLATSIFLVSILGLFIKFMAIAIQQKVFGENLGKYIYIRKLVEVNSSTTKSIKIILETPGMNLAKIAILCGGPDWPVSVLTGILRQDLKQMLIGSIPVYLLILPCVCTGAFLTQTGDIWEAIASITLISTALLQGLSILIAMYYIHKFQTRETQKIDLIPPDIQVEEYENQQKEHLDRYNQFTNWHRENPSFPYLQKMILIFGAVSTILYCYLFQFWSEVCFQNYEITDDLEKIQHNPLNIIKTTGYYGLLLFSFSICTLILFKSWVSCNISNK